MSGIGVIVRPVVHVNGKWLAQAVTGTQRYAAEMVQGLIRANRFELVVHIPADVQAPDWMRDEHVEIRRAPVSGMVFEQLYLPVASFGRMLLNFAGPAPLLKRRSLVTMHDAATFRSPETYRRAFVWFYFVMYWLLGRTARQVATVSQFSARELADVLGIRAERFMIVPCAADAIAAIEPERPDLDLGEQPYLAVGRAAANKNLAAPLAALSGSGRRVVVVGMADTAVFTADTNLGKYAVIAGRLTDGELVWLYQNCRALVFPSKYEGFGLPPLEAQILGCPVVCSTAASIPEVCGDAALYFDPDDTDELLAQIDRLEQEDGLRDELREQGFVNAQRFSWDNSAGIVAAWLAESLASSAPKASLTT